jgi:transcriptional regulator with XRE-family HTH domain
MAMSGALHTRRYRKFCQRLVEARKRAGMTQAQLADALKKSQSYVAKCEAAQRRLDVVEFLDWLNAMGIEPSRFIGEMD